MAKLLVSIICAGLAFGSASVQDKPFYQDISYRNTFNGVAPVGSWGTLPFVNAQNAVLLTKQQCLVSISDGALYAANRNTKQQKYSLDSPFSAWASIGELKSEVLVDIISARHAGDTFFAVTQNNILKVKVASSSTPGACESISSVVPVVNATWVWGSITSASASASHIWAITSDSKLIQVSLQDGSARQVAIPAQQSPTEPLSGVYWVEAWNKLFVSGATAFYTLSVSAEGAVTKSYREWVGGVLDTVVTSLSYDHVNDAVWVSEANSVHKLSRDGMWLRFGQRQGSTSANITSVVASNGFVWVGSKFGVSRFRGDASGVQVYKSITTVDGAVGEQSTADSKKAEDPWSWMYYAGNAYLPDDDVMFLVSAVSCSGSSAAAPSVVLVGTATGLTYLEASQWTLAEKSVVYESFQKPRHFRMGLTTGCMLTRYGDLTSFQKECDDNDGLWTAMHAMGEVYRYLSTGEEDARTAAWQAFEALELLAILPGAYPSFPARSFCTVDENAAGNGCSGEAWKPSEVNKNFMWKSTTSSDEIDGHLAIFPLIYDHIAKTEAEKQRVYALIEGITGGILKNDLYLIDPSTGQPTKWGFWNPALVNDDPDHYSERGPNSVGILSYLASAYSVTKDAKYKDMFWKLAIEHDYLLNALNGKVDNPVEDNHSDNELLFQMYHILMYSLQRLKSDTDSALRSDVTKMVEALLPSFHRTWAIVQGELSPLWLGIYAGLGGQRVGEQAVSDAVWTLRHWALDLISWPVNNAHRWDVTPSPFFSRDGEDVLTRQILPPQARRTAKWNSDPFEMTGGNGYSEEAPYIWQLPYYLMRYNKLIE